MARTLAELDNAMRVIYLCHPVSGDVKANLESARKWFLRIQEANPDDAIIMPWYAQCLIYDNESTDGGGYDAWLRRDCELVSRCDGVVLCGDRISKGMQLEVDAVKPGGYVWDLTGQPLSVYFGCSSYRLGYPDGVWVKPKRSRS